MGELRGVSSAELMQLGPLFEAIRLCGKRRVAVDGGAHVGTWATVMAYSFERVVAFEPCAETCELLCHNTGHHGNVEVRQAALMDVPGRVSVRQSRPKSVRLSARYVEADPEGDVPAVALDGLDIAGLDLLKLDLEGAEALALKGAARTIAAQKPVLVVEICDHGRRFGWESRDVEALIAGMGYERAVASGVDQVWVAA